jgi:hypothetical protein
VIGFLLCLSISLLLWAPSLRHFATYLFCLTVFHGTRAQAPHRHTAHIPAPFALSRSDWLKVSVIRRGPLCVLVGMEFFLTALFHPRDLTFSCTTTCLALPPLVSVVHC